MNRKNLVSLIIVIVIVAAVIFGVYYFKHKDDNKSMHDQNKVVTTQKNATSDKNNDKKTDDITKDKSDDKFRYEETTPINYEVLKKDKLPIIVNYGSEGCIPCREFKPVIMKIHDEYKGRAYVKYVDVWEHPEAVETLPVRVIPTQIFVDSEGKPYNPNESKLRSYRLSQQKDPSGNILYTFHEGPLSYDDLNDILKDMGIK